MIPYTNALLQGVCLIACTLHLKNESWKSIVKIQLFNSLCISITLSCLYSMKFQMLWQVLSSMISSDFSKVIIISFCRWEILCLEIFSEMAKIKKIVSGKALIFNLRTSDSQVYVLSHYFFFFFSKFILSYLQSLILFLFPWIHSFRNSNI